MNKRILIIDDDTELQRALQEILEGEGYEVIVAADGMEGLARLEDTPPDLILLDLIMPRMDGLIFVEELQRRKRRAAFPILLLTGDMSRGPAAVSRIGAEGFLTKPFEIDTLLEKIAHLLVSTPQTALAAVKAMPDNFRVWFRFGQVLTQTSEPSKAARSYLQAFNWATSFEETRQALQALAALPVALGQHAQPLLAAADQVRHDPQNPDLWSQLGEHLSTIGDAAKSVDCYQRAMNLNPDLRVSPTGQGAVARATALPPWLQNP